MTDNAKIQSIAPIAAIPGGGGGADLPRSRTQANSERAIAYRLVIEQGPTTGSFIYKLLDRVTGEVIRQIPREDIATLLKNDRYAAGAVAETWA